LALSGRCSQRTEEMSLGGRFLCPPLAPAAWLTLSSQR
jgi:hypothetical protein